MTRAELRELLEKGTARPWRLDGNPAWSVESEGGEAVAISQQSKPIRDGGNELRTANAALIVDKVRLTAPSRGVDLMLTALVQSSETYLVEAAFPGSWEGAMDVVGTVDGKRVWGVAFLEQFNQP